MQILNLVALNNINTVDETYAYLILLTRKDYSHGANILIENTKMAASEINKITFGDSFYYLLQPELRDHFLAQSQFPNE